jgi:hypothetical protein
MLFLKPAQKNPLYVMAMVIYPDTLEKANGGNRLAGLSGADVLKLTKSPCSPINAAPGDLWGVVAHVHRLNAILT